MTSSLINGDYFSPLLISEQLIATNKPIKIHGNAEVTKSVIICGLLITHYLTGILYQITIKTSSRDSKFYRMSVKAYTPAVPIGAGGFAVSCRILVRKQRHGFCRFTLLIILATIFMAAAIRAALEIGFGGV